MSCLAWTSTTIAGDVVSSIEDDPTTDRESFRFGLVDGYDRITYGGSGAGWNPERAGYPDLPTLRFRYLLPPGSEVTSITVTPTSTSTLDGQYLPYPLQPPAEGERAADFIPADSEIYESEVPYPPTVGSLSSQGSMRGFVLADVEVSPFEYTGASRTLKLHTTFDVTLSLSARGEEQQRLIRVRKRLGSQESPRADEIDWLLSSVRNARDFDRFYAIEEEEIEQRAVADSAPAGDAIPTEFPSVESPPVDYLIVTTEALEGEFDRLASWKIDKGVPAAVRTVEWIDENYPGVDTPERIRNFLIDAYEQWSTDWVLLGGDLNEVPARHFWSSFSHNPGQAPRDGYYAGIDGTWNSDEDFRWAESTGDLDSSDPYWDLWLGRVPARTPDEASAIVDKLLDYSRGPHASGSGPTDTGFYKRFLAFAGLTTSLDWGEESNGIWLAWANAHKIDELSGWTERVFAEAIWDNVLDTNGCYIDVGTDSLEASAMVEAWDGHELRAALDDGYNLVFHSEHSYFNHEGGASVGASESAFCESLLTVVNRSTDAHLDLNDEEVLALQNGTLNGPGAYSVVVSRGSFVGGMDGNSVSESWIRNPNGGAIAYIGRTRSSDGQKGPFTEFFQNFVDNDWCLGQTYNASLENLNTALAFNLLGDPEMWIWKDTPKDFDALQMSPTALSALGPQAVSITVEDGSSPVEGARVCLNQNLAAYAVGYTNASGVATFPDFSPRSDEDVLVTVSLDGYAATQDTISVSATNPAFVRYDGHEFEEVPGSSNENDRAEAAEDLKLIVQVENAGDSTSAASTVRLVANEQFTIERTNHDSGFPTNLVIGESRTEVEYDTFDTVTLPLHQTAIRPEGEPSGISTTSGIYLWRDLDGTWNLKMVSNNLSPREAGTSRVPLNTVAVFTLSVPEGYPSIHTVQTSGFEGLDAATTLGNGDLKVTFVNNTAAPIDTDVVTFLANEDEWLDITTATSSLGALSAGATDTVSFQLEVSPNIPDPYHPSFTLYAETAGGDLIGLSEFSTELSAPRFELLKLDFVDLPGDTARIAPFWSQYGGGDADSVIVWIESAHANTAVLGDTLRLAPYVAGAYGSLADSLRFITTASSTDAQLDLFAKVFCDRGGAADTLLFEFPGLDLSAPSAPTNVRLWQFREGQHTIQWEPVAGAAWYNVYRSFALTGSHRTLTNRRQVTSATEFNWVTTLTGDYRWDVTAVDSVGNESAASSYVEGRPTYKVHSGWPKFLPVGSDVSVPIIADIDDDDDYEVIAATDRVYAWNIDGTPYLSTEVFYDPDPDSVAIFSTALAAADLDGDDDLEIVACSRDTAYVFSHTGAVLLAAAVDPSKAPPVIADIDGDVNGYLEVLITSSGDEKIYAWDKDLNSFYSGQGGAFADLPAGVKYSYGSLSVTDLDGDGGMDIIHAPGRKPTAGSTAILKVYTSEDTSPADNRADLLWEYDTGLSTRVWKPAIGDVDGDGEDEIVFAQGTGGASSSQIVILSAIEDSAKVEHIITDPVLPRGIGSDDGPAMALANLDSDDNLEIIVGLASAFDGYHSSDSLSVSLAVVQAYEDTAFVQECVLWAYKPYLKSWGESGQVPQPNVVSSPAVANIDSDGAIEMIVGSDLFVTHMVEWDESDSTCVPERVPFLLQEGYVRATPQLGDFTGDGKLDVVTFDDAGVLTVLNLEQTTPGTIEWAGFGNDLLNSGRHGSASSIAPPQGGPGSGSGIVLNQNRPNPFNPRTTFTYAVDREGHVELAIYDVAGREVATLVNENVKAGIHSLQWDGTDNNGHELASGMFFYRLRADDTELTRKLLIVR